jgi:electron transfer flavoprotein-quinone oxidoreductase
MKMDAVIVGAGLAGLAAAERLADAGLQVVVLERGDGPGTKNVTGGRLYVDSVRDRFPEWWDEAPLERAVTHEAWTVLDGTSSVRVDYQDESLGGAQPASYTVLRSRFDAWLGERVRGKGAFLIPEKPVTELLYEDGRVAGVQVDGEEIPAEAVIACDGLLSFVGQAAGLRAGPRPPGVAVGVKEVIGLPAGTIEDRFGLEAGEGAAELFLGSLTRGMMGGGFCYTNRDSLSLGLVVGVGDLMDKGGEAKLPELLDAFKAQPRLRPLLRGGELLEYSAHLIPEGGLADVPKLVGDGILLAGDAAGLALNMGFTVRGMEFALASGQLAAEALIAARESGDTSAAGLAGYEQSLRDSFIWSYLEQFRRMPELLENPDLFTRYPAELCGFLRDLVHLDARRPGKISAKVWRLLRRIALNPRDARFWWKLRGI